MIPVAIAGILKGLTDVLPVVSTLFNVFKKRPFIRAENKHEAIKVFYDKETDTIQEVAGNGSIVAVPTKQPNYIRLGVMLLSFGLIAWYVSGKSSIDFLQLMELLNYLNPFVK